MGENTIYNHKNKNQQCSLGCTILVILTQRSSQRWYCKVNVKEKEIKFWIFADLKICTVLRSVTSVWRPGGPREGGWGGGGGGRTGGGVVVGCGKFSLACQHLFLQDFFLPNFKKRNYIEWLRSYRTFFFSNYFFDDFSEKSWSCCLNNFCCSTFCQGWISL